MSDGLTKALALAAGLLLLGMAPVRAAPTACAMDSAAAFEATLRDRLAQVEARISAEDGAPALAGADAVADLVESCRHLSPEIAKQSVGLLLRLDDHLADLVPQQAEALARRDLLFWPRLLPGRTAPRPHGASATLARFYGICSATRRPSLYRGARWPSARRFSGPIIRMWREA